MQHFQLDRVSYKILKKERTNIDRAMLMVGILGPFATIPQIYAVYVGQDVAGLSIFSWSLYLISAFFVLAYGIVHNLRPLIISSFLWIVVDIVIVIGYFIYR